MNAGDISVARRIIDSFTEKISGRHNSGNHPVRTAVRNLFLRPGRMEIEHLPERGFQRDYIDEFLAAKREGREYRIGGRLVVAAAYGHCADYPKGFTVTLE